MVFSSSAATYGEPRQTPITEDHPQVPVNPYGDSKLIFEKMLKWYASAYDWSTVAFRYFNAAGSDGLRGEDHRPETHILPLLFQVALGRRPYFEIFGTDYSTPDGTCVRDFVHVSDIARAHILGLELLGATGLSCLQHRVRFRMLCRGSLPGCGKGSWPAAHFEGRSAPIRRSRRPCGESRTTLQRPRLAGTTWTGRNHSIRLVVAPQVSQWLSCGLRGPISNHSSIAFNPRR